MAESETQAEQHSQHLNYKTTVLKVSIHCVGCKRKVHKILQGIQGVQDINIDLRQQKVIVTGNVNSDILIHKLTNKTGKHVELWPEPTDSKKKQSKKNKEKQSDPESENSEEIEIKQNSENNNNGTGKVDTSTSKNVEVNGSTARSGNGSGDVNVNVNGKVNKPNEGSATGKSGAVHVQELKPEVRKQTVVLPVKPVAEKKVSVAVQFPNDDNEEPLTNEKTGSTGGGDSTGVKKKKKKGKGKVINNNAEESVFHVEHFRDAPGTGDSGNRSHGRGYSEGQSSNFHGQVHSGSNLTNEVPPRHYINEQFYPPQYYGPPQSHVAAAPPVVTVSHHTAYPSSSSYGAAYYAPPQPYQYAHVMNTGNEMEPQPRPYTYEPESYASPQPSDSFVYFSDENPNACNVM